MGENTRYSATKWVFLGYLRILPATTGATRGYDGLRTTDYRLQTTDYGLQTTDYRLWTTDYGLQTMDPRTTDYGPADYRPRKSCEMQDKRGSTLDGPGPRGHDTNSPYVDGTRSVVCGL